MSNLSDPTSFFLTFVCKYVPSFKPNKINAGKVLCWPHSCGVLHVKHQLLPLSTWSTSLDLSRRDCSQRTGVGQQEGQGQHSFQLGKPGWTWIILDQFLVCFARGLFVTQTAVPQTAIGFFSTSSNYVLCCFSPSLPMFQNCKFESNRIAGGSFFPHYTEVITWGTDTCVRGAKAWYAEIGVHNFSINAVQNAGGSYNSGSLVEIA